MAFSRLINQIQNQKSALTIVIVMSIFFSIAHLNVLSAIIGCLALYGIKKDKNRFLKVYFVYVLLELSFNGVFVITFFGLLMYDTYLIVVDEKMYNDNVLDEYKIDALFGLLLLISAVAYCIFMFIFRFFILSLLKKYISDTNARKGFELLESGSLDSVYQETKCVEEKEMDKKCIEKSERCIEKIEKCIEKSNSYSSESLPFYGKCII